MRNSREVIRTFIGKIGISSGSYPSISSASSEGDGEIFAMIRDALLGLGLDSANFGTPQWNPLGDFVKPGAKILIKPNWVVHENPIGGLDCTVTHPSILRAVIDYCIIAKAGEIVVGDAPIQNCDLPKLLETHGYNELFAFYEKNGIDLTIRDFRVTTSIKKSLGRLDQIKNEFVDRNDLIEFDLGELSAFNDLPDESQYCIANYHNDAMNARHYKGQHLCLIHKSLLEADLIINLPKPKTHRFAGLTGAQKNFIGACPDKEYLPHYRKGSVEHGGDETNRNTFVGEVVSWGGHKFCYHVKHRHFLRQIFFKTISWFGRKLLTHGKKRQYLGGQWYGNDTIWRTTVDINTAILYGGLDGKVDVSRPPRKILTIGDMVIAGEAEGPLEPSPKPLGIIMASTNCVAFDYVFAKIAGIDYTLIPTIKNSVENELLTGGNILEMAMKSNVKEWDDVLLKDLYFPEEFHFVCHSLWRDLLASHRR